MGVIPIIATTSLVLLIFALGAAVGRTAKRVSFQFTWYDVWVGVCIDTGTETPRLYIAPLPCCVFMVDLRKT